MINFFKRKAAEYRLLKEDGKPGDHPKALGDSPDNEAQLPELGEYSLNILLSETCNLKTETDLNAMIEVAALGRKQKTRVFPGLGPSSRTIWNENFFFFKVFASRDDFEDENLTITLFNRHHGVLTERVGFFQVSLTTLSGTSQGLHINDWGVFTDPEKEFGVAKGMLRYSLSFGPAKRQILDLVALSKDGADKGKMHIPPSVRTEYAQLVVSVFMARNVVPVDYGGTSDPYVKANFGGVKLPTRAVQKNLNPKFYQKILIPIMEPSITDRVMLKLYDENKLLKNQRLGSQQMSLKEIRAGKHRHPRWVQFYSAPKSSTILEVKSLMDKQPEYASTYAGEVLLAVELQAEARPKLEVVDMKTEEFDRVDNDMRPIHYQLQLDVPYIYNVDLPPGKYHLVLSWGSNEGLVRLPVHKVLNRLLIFNNTFFATKSVEIHRSYLHHEDDQDLLAQIPDAFVYLTVDGKNVCFYRLSSATMIRNTLKEAHDFTVKLKPEMSVTDITYDQAGYMRMRVSMVRVSADDEFKSLRDIKHEKQEKPESPKSSKKKSAENPTQRFGKGPVSPNTTVHGSGSLNVNASRVPGQSMLSGVPVGGNIGPNPADPASPMIPKDARKPEGKILMPPIQQSMRFQDILIFINLFQARDLIPVEADGLPDTLIEFYHFGSAQRSGLVKNQLNPQYNHSFVLKSVIVNEEIPALIVSVVDKEPRALVGGYSEQVIGNCVINLTGDDRVGSPDEVSFTAPTWRPLLLAKTVNAGEVLMSVRWALAGSFPGLSQLTSLQSKAISVPKEKYFMKIVVLGLRSLKPKGFLPVKKAEVKIETQSVAEEGTSALLSEYSVYSRTGGNDPAFGQIIHTTAHLPANIWAIPSLLAVATDQSYVFSNNALIGQATIELSCAFYISKIRWIEKLKMTKKCLNFQAKSEGRKGMDPLQLTAIDSIIARLSANLPAEQKHIYSNYPAVKEQEEKIRDDFNRFDILLPSHFRPDGVDPEADAVPNPNQPSIGTEGFLPGDPQSERQMLTGDKALQPPKDSKGPKKEAAVALVKPSEVVVGGGKGAKSQPLFSNFFKHQSSLKLEKNKSRSSLTDFATYIAQDPTVLTPDEFAQLPKERQSGYLQLGYRQDDVTDTRHFRRYIETDLESSAYIGADRFNTVKLSRGKQSIKRGRGFFDFLRNSFSEDLHQTGLLRGCVDLLHEATLNDLMALPLSPEDKRALEIPNSLDDWHFERMDSLMLSGIWAEIHLYVISAKFDVNCDAFSENDGQIRVKFNGKTVKGTKTIDDNNAPFFYERFTLRALFPGSSNLEVQFFDEDPVGADLIGSTAIDVERRFFDGRLHRYFESPIEKRQIFTENGDNAGHCLMWLNMVKTVGSVKPWDIAPRPPVKAFLRVIVWTVKRIRIYSSTGVADLYVAVSIPSLNKQQQTDVHYRSADGFGSFNWRMEFEVVVDENYKYENAKMTVKVFDKEFFQKNEFLADQEIDFREFLQEFVETGRSRFMGGLGRKARLDDVEGYKLHLKPGKKEDSGGLPAYVMISIEILGEADHNARPAGLGRSAPNDNPFLPAPTERDGFSLNPSKILSQMIGRQLRISPFALVGILIAVWIFLVFVPILIASIISYQIAKKT